MHLRGEFGKRSAEFGPKAWRKSGDNQAVKMEAKREQNGIHIDIEKVFERHPFAEQILKKLKERGFDAVLIGGAVRDGVRAELEEGYVFDPGDVDIATSALPEEVKQIFKRNKIVEVGEPFGVLMLVSPDGREYEVATYRVESKYDGRWPGEVKLGRDLEGDVKRRDLTINGLAARADGRVIDYVGGIQDLKAKLIRTIGDPEERFREDYLRILRAIRCACVVDGKLTDEVSQAIKRNRKRLRSISWERIKEELLKILETNSSAGGFRLLDEHRLLELIMRELTATKGIIQPEKYHPEGDVFEHTLLALGVADRFGSDPLVKLGILLHDIGKPVALERNQGESMAGHEVIGEKMAEEIGRRLRLSTEQIKIVKYLVRQHMRIANFPKMNRGKQITFMKEGENPAVDVNDLHSRFPLFAKLLQLLIADCEASVHRASGWLPVIKEVVEVIQHIKELDELETARKLLDGRDILEMGVEEGPEVGRILKEVYDQILAGRIRSREQALGVARKLAQSL